MTMPLNVPKQCFLNGHRRTEQKLSVWISMARKELDLATEVHDEEGVYSAASMLDALCRARNEVRLRIAHNGG